MEDMLIEVLSTLGYPVMLQGSLLQDEPYPDTFFTFWNDSADGDGYFDNKETTIIWKFSINVYSTDPVKVNSLLLQAKTLLQEQSWIVSGAGYSVASDEPTHTGRGIEVYFRQMEVQE